MWEFSEYSVIPVGQSNVVVATGRNGSAVTVGVLGELRYGLGSVIYWVVWLYPECTDRFGNVGGCSVDEVQQKLTDLEVVTDVG